MYFNFNLFKIYNIEFVLFVRLIDQNTFYV